MVGVNQIESQGNCMSQVVGRALKLMTRTLIVLFGLTSLLAVPAWPEDKQSDLNSTQGLSSMSLEQLMN